ncbi:enterochelin esterase [Sphingomonas sp. RHCKR7]|uniref:alpha/beta hydrolase-fold protein n=1 Tax=Sphingomonas folli TaxID=2862497 RepID=UPI001CA53BDE|nr:alpha/beta hydrolase-fold protein [Sphingomonas folli]MBW6528527.1 enterochelin esterase [Sphingomonas folli]
MIPTRLRSLLVLAAMALIGATKPADRVTVTLPRALAADAGGRLLLFAAPLRAGADAPSMVDLDAAGVVVAGSDVAGFGRDRRAEIDTAKAVPVGLESLPPGTYGVQVVLDQDGDYGYAGRGSGDLVSRALTLRLPLTAPVEIALDHMLPPATGPFDTEGLPPVAAAQIQASRLHLHDEVIDSPLLSRFYGTPRAVRAWVLTPPGYDPRARTTYPTVFTAGGFGATHRLDAQQLSRQWHLMETGEIPPMIWVALDYATRTGTTEFVDSANDGPWDAALMREVIPTLEARYRMDARPSGRFLTGHSSGGWFALATMIRHPTLFGASWASAPDPVDFHDFLGADLYAAHAELYRDDTGRARPLERAGGAVRQTVEQAAQLEAMLGHEGGQLRSFEWVFSPRGADGLPVALFDRASGVVNPHVARYWIEHHDLARQIERASRRRRAALDGKLHVIVGDADSYYLDGSVRRFEAALREAGVRADVRYVPGATHSMSQLYAQDGDRSALWKEMTRVMLAVAGRSRAERRPG